MVDKPLEPVKAAVRAWHAAGFGYGDLRGCSIKVAANAVFTLNWLGLLGQ